MNIGGSMGTLQNYVSAVTRLHPTDIQIQLPTDQQLLIYYEGKLLTRSFKIFFAQ